MTAINNSPNPNLPPLPWHKRHARLWMGAALLAADLLALGLSASAVLGLRRIWEVNWNSDCLETFALVGISTIILLGLRGLYPGIGVSPITEIRHTSISISIAAFGLAAVSFLIPSFTNVPRFSLGIFWLISLFSMPVARITTRYSLSRLPAWGEPVILFGGGKRVQFVYEHLHKRRMLGFDPVILSAQSETIPLDIHSPYLELEKLIEQPESLRRMGIRTALITAGSVPEPLHSRLLHLQGSLFERLIKVPDQHDLGSLGVSTLDLDGIFAYEVRQNLSSKSRRAFKRGLDLGLTLFGGLLISPILLAIAALVKFTSRGPVFYKQTRIGKGGQKFQAWKFRTMVKNAEELLDKTLSETPGMREEWEATQKLKRDPRITRIGSTLRKFSLDELPQLWNVLLGEMSLVGPRPCMEDQICLYGDNFEVYTAVQPGITGLWQVSGRNDTTYAERVRLDAYYVRNWSLWMDAYILFKTFWVVLKSDGAY